MSSPQDPYHGFDQSALYYDSGPSPTVTQLSHSPPPWMTTATSDDQGGYSQPHQSGDMFNAEDMNYAFNHPQINYPSQGTSFQVPNPQPDSTYNAESTSPIRATFTDDFSNVQNNFHFDITAFAPYDFSNLVYRHSYPPGPSHGFPGQPYADHASQTNDLTSTLGVYDSRDTYGLQPPQGNSALGYRSSSLTQLSSVGGGGPVPVYGGSSGSVQHTTGRLKLDGINTARAELANAGVGQHSHSSPVANSPPSQFPAAGPSRPPPGSPDRKRSPVDEESSTSRNVVPRSSRAWSVHSTSSDSHKRTRIADVPGRGLLIPQDRYTTSSVSAFNTTYIPFDLENPNQTGIPIVDILNKTGSFHRIRDRTQAFNHMGGKKTFTLRVQWPGYKPWCKTIAALNWKKSRAPITRVKLAEDIATAIRDLLQKKRDEPFDPDYAAWNLGPNGIQLEQLCLVALHHVSKGSWQPQLCLLQPSQR